MERVDGASWDWTSRPSGFACPRCNSASPARVAAPEPPGATGIAGKGHRRPSGAVRIRPCRARWSDDGGPSDGRVGNRVAKWEKVGYGAVKQSTGVAGLLPLRHSGPDLFVPSAGT